MILAFSSCQKDELNQGSVTEINGLSTDLLSKPSPVKIKYGKVMDIEGNVYKTVKIGTQWWMAENLKTTKYNDGTPIPEVTSVSEWINLEGPGYSWYANDPMYKDIYGALYSYYVTDPSSNGYKNVCPIGWHVSTATDRNNLADYLGGLEMAGGQLKATGTLEGDDGLWLSPNTGATNSTGFSALPGGAFVYDGDPQGTGDFKHIGEHGLWWAYYSSQWVGAYILSYYDAQLNPFSVFDKNCGFSIRCMKDKY